MEEDVEEARRMHRTTDHPPKAIEFKKEKTDGMAISNEYFFNLFDDYGVFLYVECII